MNGKGERLIVHLGDEEAWALCLVLRNPGTAIRYTASTLELMERIRQNVIEVADRQQRNLPRYA